MSGMVMCCQGASCSPWTLPSKSGGAFSASNPSHRRIILRRDGARGFASTLRREAFGGASQRSEFLGGNGACGGNRWQVISAIRVTDFSFGANKVPYTGLFNVGLVCSTAMDVRIHLPYENTVSSSFARAMDDAGTVPHLEEDENPVPNERPRPKSGKQKRAEVAEELGSGRSPLDILKSMTEWSPSVFWGVVEYLHSHRRMPEALEVFEWWKQQDGYRRCELHYTKFIRMLGQAQMPAEARALFIEMCSLGLRPSAVTYTCLLQSYAERGQFEEAELILKDMVLSGDAKPNAVTYTGLIHAYGKQGLYDSMWRTFNRMKTHGVPADEFTYRTMIKAYACGGLFEKMQLTAKEMSRNNMFADSPTLNAVVKAYAEAGLVKEMEKHFEILTKYSFIPGHLTIKAMVWAYVKNSLFFQLSVFVKRVGLRRRTVGNYLWNAFLLSRAANFAMKDLKMEFENMKYAGFFPDVTTCNIMALAFSRMKQLWELHELIITMQNNGIAPDLVTYGAVIDVFVEEDLRPKLLEELVEFRNLDVVAEVETDPVVFEVFGRGGFLIACQTLSRNMEGQAMGHQTYSQLIGYFLQSLSKGKRKARRQVSSPP